MGRNRRAVLEQRVQPKLRMIANGSTEVNALRAEHAAAIAVRGEVARRVPELRTEDSVPVTREALKKPPRTTKLRERPEAEASIFVQLVRAAKPGDEPPGLQGAATAARTQNLRTARLSVTDARALGEHPEVAYVELGQPLSRPTPVVTSESPKRPRLSSRRFGSSRAHRQGAGVLMGIIDVGGFDFAHPDFLDAGGKTRFVRIWDQGGSNRLPPAKRDESEPAKGPFDYGSEIRKDEMDQAIVAAPGAGLAPALLEPQSQATPGSHATHVASIAAGNRGVCGGAAIAAVLIDIPESDYERRRSFYDSTRIAHAVDYLLTVAEELGDDNGPLPLSINISLGTNGHAHDDSSPVSRWIDNALTRPGRSVCVAAGNAGQERPETEGDVGWIMGRIHSGGRIAARDLVSDIEWNVVGNGIADLSENELEIWYGAQDRFAIQIKPPNEPWTNVVEPGEFIENRELDDGTFLSVYNELYHPANGANYVSVFLSPRLREPQVVGVQAGLWLVRLIGREVRDGTYHCWIERDDPRPAGRLGPKEAWRFPSFFSERSNVDNSSVSSLACGQRIVSVANLDEARRRISITSSQGPTRDGRQKPDTAAPGTDIVAAKGFATTRDEWIAMSGTSMASPYVSGVIGLMLAVNPELTGAQIGGIIKRTAKPLPGNDFSWRDDAGSGVIDPEGCLEEADSMRERVDVTEP